MQSPILYLALGLIAGGTLASQSPEAQKPGQASEKPAKPASAPATAKAGGDDVDLRPPFTGAPAKGSRGRMQPAASRGTADDHNTFGDDLLFTTVAPVNSVAVTTSAQPVLYWHIAKSPPCKVVFTFTVDTDDLPLIEKELAVSSSGLQEIRLADFGLTLEPGTTYRWFVALVPDADRRSRDLISGAMLRYDLNSSDAWHDRFSSAYERTGTVEDESRLLNLLRDAGLTQLGHPSTSRHQH